MEAIKKYKEIVKDVLDNKEYYIEEYQTDDIEHLVHFKICEIEDNELFKGVLALDKEKVGTLAGTEEVYREILNSL